MRGIFSLEIKLAAYDLFMEGITSEEIVKRLDKVSRKRFRRPGPKKRTIDEWRRSPEWQAEKKLRIQKAQAKRAEEYADKVHSSLEELEEVSDYAVNQLREYVKDGIKPSLAVLYNIVYQINQEKARRYKGLEKPVDFTDVLKSGLGVFIRNCSKRLGKVFDDSLDEILTDTIKDLEKEQHVV